MHSSRDAEHSSNGDAKRSSTRRGLWHRLLRSLGIGLGMAAAAVPALAQAPASPVPQHWISYANLASNQLGVALSDPANVTVVLLHAWMQERMLKEGQPVPPVPLVVRLWVAANGQVERSTFSSLGDAQADDYLRSLLMAQTLSEPPPRDMRQPMVLQLTLTFVNHS